MIMTVTLETIYREIQQVRSELHRVRDMLEDEGELADEAQQDLDKARDLMARGQYATHEEVLAKYG
jgi:exonuclease VII small subunit